MNGSRHPLRALPPPRAAIAANTNGSPVTRNLVAKGVSFGTITASPGGSVNTSGVKGVNPDLRVRPFFAEGSSFSIREFAVGAFNAEMGLEAFDPDLLAASAGGGDHPLRPGARWHQGHSPGASGPERLARLRWRRRGQ